MLLSDSNFTKGCGGYPHYAATGIEKRLLDAGGISLKIQFSGTNHINICLSNVVLTKNQGVKSGGLVADIHAPNSKILLAITNCKFLQEKGALVSAIWIQNEFESSLTVSIKKHRIFRKCLF